VKVIWQYDNCCDVKCVFLPHAFKCASEGVDVVDQQFLTPIPQIDREEPTFTRHERATMVRHDDKLTSWMLACAFKQIVMHTTLLISL
jgi:hypothetical protein